MNTQRIYIPGDHWLYYKIYCGARTADTILTNTLKPITEELINQEIISKWFFIRYNDPDSHLRIRFYVNNTKDSIEVIQRIHRALQFYVKNDIVHSVQLDTYKREFERYGTNTIDTSEVLFYHESHMLISVIEIVENEELYFLFVLRAIDRLLESFDFDLEHKLRFALMNMEAYKTEFEANTLLNKQLDKKYRHLRQQIELFVTPNPLPSDYVMLDRLLDHKHQNTKKELAYIKACNTDSTMQMSLDNLISSYIHMLVNRAFRSRQRFYELVCYDFLTKFYKSKQYKHV